MGMDGMLNAYPDDCKYTFFFTRIELSSWFRVFLKVILILSAIPVLVFLTSGTVNLARVTCDFIFRRGWHGITHYLPPELQANHQTPMPSIKLKASNERPRLQFDKLRLFNLILSGMLLIFIIAAELTIQWNKIKAVQAIGSTGQLLPVLVGVGCVGRVLIRLISDLLGEVALRKQKKQKKQDPGWMATSGRDTRSTEATLVLDTRRSEMAVSGSHKWQDSEGMEGMVASTAARLNHYAWKGFDETAANLDNLREAIHAAAYSLMLLRISSCPPHDFNQTNSKVPPNFETYQIAATISKFIWRIIDNGKFFTEEANKVLNQVALCM